AVATGFEIAVLQSTPVNLEGAAGVLGVFHLALYDLRVERAAIDFALVKVRRERCVFRFGGGVRATVDFVFADHEIAGRRGGLSAQTHAAFNDVVGDARVPR